MSKVVLSNVLGTNANWSSKRKRKVRCAWLNTCPRSESKTKKECKKCEEMQQSAVCKIKVLSMMPSLNFGCFILWQSKNTSFGLIYLANGYIVLHAVRPAFRTDTFCNVLP